MDALKVQEQKQYKVESLEIKTIFKLIIKNTQSTFNNTSKL